MDNIDGIVEQLFTYPGARFSLPPNARILHSEPVIKNSDNKTVLELWVLFPDTSSRLGSTDSYKQKNQPNIVPTNSQQKYIRSVDSSHIIDVPKNTQQFKNNINDDLDEHTDGMYDDYDYDNDIEDDFYYD